MRLRRTPTGPARNALASTPPSWWGPGRPRPAPQNRRGPSVQVCIYILRSSSRAKSLSALTAAMADDGGANAARWPLPSAEFLRLKACRM